MAQTLLPLRSRTVGQATLPSADLLAGYKLMYTARRIDEKAVTLYKQNKCYFQLSSSGHEAVQVAAAKQMQAGVDYAYPYYREMGFVVALGLTNRDLFLNILSKDSDPNSGGRQMPMHYGSKQLNIVSQSSVTGTQFLQAVGTAHALKLKGEKAVVYCSSGEGTTAQGCYHEALNWAAKEQLPIVFLVQNNRYAISVPIESQLAGGSVAKISRSYEGLTVTEVDGLNYTDSFNVLKEAFERARTESRPTVIDASVVRLQSHSISDNQSKYRSAKELSAELEKDPLKLLAAELIKLGYIDRSGIKKLEAEIEKQIDADAEWAEAQSDPDISTALDHILAGKYPSDAKETDPAANGESLFLVDALNTGLSEELQRNSSAVVYGQDVAGGKGGVFTVTTGLTAKYGEARVFNSPLAEDSIVGTAIGMSVAGLKPIVEIQFGDYIWTAMMQIRNELAPMYYRSNGVWSCPVVVRVAVGGYIRGGIYHSQNIESIFAHTPGLVVVMPSNAADAKGLLKSAIRCADPVLFLEHKGLYRQVFAKSVVGDKEHLVPIGKARITRGGDAATVITYGALVQKSLVAANKVQEKLGKEVEVIDLRTLSPLDTDTIAKSVKKTGRLLVAYEDHQFLGYGAEIVAHLTESLFEYLDAPPIRVAGKNVFIAQAPAIEQAVLPQTEEIELKLIELLTY